MNAEPPQTGRRILIIDDNPAIHADIRKILGAADGPCASGLNATKALLFDESSTRPAPTEFIIDSASQGEEGLALVKQAQEQLNPYALAFVDVRMPPGWDGIETAGRLWSCCPELQIVLCTAFSDYSWNQMIQKLGASASLVVLKKPFDNIEVLQLAHALTEKWRLNRSLQTQLDNLDQLVHQRTAELEAANGQLKREIDARIATEGVLRISEERFSKAFNASPIPLAIQSLQSEILVDANAAFLATLEGRRDQIVGQTPAQLGLWPDPALIASLLQTLPTESGIRNHECHCRTLGGQERQVLLSIEPVELNAAPHLLILLQDITERVKMEGQLRQSQKMEAMGQLAAGVAHDFNNVLTAIHGHTSLLQMQLAQHPNCARSLTVISLAAERATRLVRQLLTFSRKQVIHPQLLDLSQVAAHMADMLKRILGGHVQFDLHPDPSGAVIKADISMMEQIILNLCVNARDAMPRGGRVTLHIQTVGLRPKPETGAAGTGPGRFVCLSVTDTGSGIAPEHLSRIFDPFFTTKEPGKGTGLGLATIFGIVKQHNGIIDVESVVGRGTTFHIYLPASEESLPKEAGPGAAPATHSGRECVLVVEDEAMVRSIVVSVLGSQGYRVLEAADGKEALALFREHSQEVALLITDLIMPGNMLGDELAAHLRVLNPSLPVIFASGFSPDADAGGRREEAVRLTKPFTPTELLHLVRQVLDGDASQRFQQSSLSATPR